MALFTNRADKFDEGGMLDRVGILVIALGLALGTLAVRSSADPEVLPPPRPLQSNGPPRPFEAPFCERFSPAEFDQSIAELKKERDALDADRKTFAKSAKNDRSSAQSANSEYRILRDQLTQLRDALRKSRQASQDPPPETTPVDPPVATEPDPLPIIPKHSNIMAPPETVPIDPLALAHMQMRAEKYEASLASLRRIDLQGKKANERGPILFLTAACLQRVGKVDEAIPMLRDIANSRGDEQIAAYAQWQLEFIRWRKDMTDKLQALRQRRMALENALEKRP
jgi:hypothetical protein